MRDGQESREWSEAAAVGTRPNWARWVPAAASFVLLEGKHHHQWDLLTFASSFLALEGRTGSLSSYGDRRFGLGTGPSSIFCSQLSPAMSNAMATQERPPASPAPLPCWCAVWGSVTPALSRHGGGTAVLVWDPHGLGPHCLLPAPAGPCHPAGAHGKVSVGS